MKSSVAEAEGAAKLAEPIKDQTPQNREIKRNRGK